MEQKDATFIEAVYRTTREAELNLSGWSEYQKNAFISMQSNAQLHDYRSKFPNGLFQIIVYNKKDAGRLFTHESEDAIRLIDISLLPEFIGKGIGTELLQRLIKRSNEVQKKILLQVYATNPALKLYQRSGFEATDHKGLYCYMERKPDSV